MVRARTTRPSFAGESIGYRVVLGVGNENLKFEQNTNAVGNKQNKFEKQSVGLQEHLHRSVLSTPFHLTL